jgi:hypothetical protein
MTPQKLESCEREMACTARALGGSSNNHHIYQRKEARLPAFPTKVFGNVIFELIHFAKQISYVAWVFNN